MVFEANYLFTFGGGLQCEFVAVHTHVGCGCLRSLQVRRTGCSEATMGRAAHRSSGWEAAAAAAAEAWAREAEDLAAVAAEAGVVAPASLGTKAATFAKQSVTGASAGDDWNDDDDGSPPAIDAPPAPDELLTSSVDNDATANIKKTPEPKDEEESDVTDASMGIIISTKAADSTGSDEEDAPAVFVAAAAPEIGLPEPASRIDADSSVGHEALDPTSVAGGGPEAAPLEPLPASDTTEVPSEIASKTLGGTNRPEALSAEELRSEARRYVARLAKGKATSRDGRYVQPSVERIRSGVVPFGVVVTSPNDAAGRSAGEDGTTRPVSPATFPQQGKNPVVAASATTTVVSAAMMQSIMSRVLAVSAAGAAVTPSQPAVPPLASSVAAGEVASVSARASVGDGGEGGVDEEYAVSMEAMDERPTPNNTLTEDGPLIVPNDVDVESSFEEASIDERRRLLALGAKNTKGAVVSAGSGPGIIGSNTSITITTTTTTTTSSSSGSSSNNGGSGGAAAVAGDPSDDLLVAHCRDMRSGGSRHGSFTTSLTQVRRAAAPQSLNIIARVVRAQHAQ